MEQNLLKSFGIGEAVEMTGITHKQLRYWETLKLIPLPERIVCGDRAYRRYSEAHIQLFQEIKHNLEQGYALITAIRLAREKFEGEEQKNGDKKKQ